MKSPDARSAVAFPAVQASTDSAVRALFARNTGALALASALLLFWYFVVPYLVPAYVFPTVETVARKVVVILAAAKTYADIVDTMQRILGGFAISAVIGICLGIALAMSKQTYATLMPAVRFIMGIPALTWVLLAIIWFRSTEVRVWFLMIMLMAPIVTVNTYDGVRSIPHDLYQMVLSFRPSKWRLLRLIVIPGATPFVFSGLKVGLSFGGRFVVFAEAMSADSGIGSAMYTLNQTFDTAGIIVWTLLLVLLLSLLDMLLGRLERYWFRWRRDFRE